METWDLPCFLFSTIKEYSLIRMSLVQATQTWMLAWLQPSRRAFGLSRYLRKCNTLVGYLESRFKNNE